MLIVLKSAAIGRLDERIARKLARGTGAVFEELRNPVIVNRVLWILLMQQNQRQRKITVVNPPGLAGLIESIVDRVLIVEMKMRMEKAIRHQHAALRCAALREQPVRPRGTGHRRMPGVADGE